MNKHAKNLRALLALLPIEVCQVYRESINNAADEIDRLESKCTSDENQCDGGIGWAGLDSVQMP